MCFLDNEELQVRRDQLVMRATGDVVEVTNRGLLFLGRQDDQVKRHGKRISLFHVRRVNILCAVFHLNMSRKDMGVFHKDPRSDLTLSWT